MAKRIFVDATQFRQVIEPQAAALAATNSTQMQRELLRMSSEAVEAESTIDDMLAADFAFHATVLDASDSLILKQFRGFLHAILNFSYSTNILTVADSRVEPNAHSKVATAIVEGNAELAEQQMRQMLAVNIEIANRNTR